MAMMSAGDAKDAALFQEMGRDPKIVYAEMNSIHHGLRDAYGADRVLGFGIDEMGVNGFVHGAAIAGNPAIASISNMVPAYYFTFLFDIGSSIRYASGGAAHAPFTLIQQGSSRASPGRGANHAVVGEEAWYSCIPGLKVVIPSDAYYTKGLLVAAIRDPDPVMLIDYRGQPAADVPDDPDFVVPIGEPRIVKTGSDITVLAFAPALWEVEFALTELEAKGYSVEVINPLTVHPLNYAPIVESVAKTGKLLTVDHGWHRTGACTQVMAMVAEALGPQATYRRLGYPDVWTPGAREMTDYMTPWDKNVVEAVEVMLS